MKFLNIFKSKTTVAEVEWEEEDFEDDDDDLDVWAPDEWGYADMLVGKDTWEDQAGMEAIKRQLKIPDEWYLIKVVNFSYSGDRSLAKIEEWLKANCRYEYRRVGWSSNCTTKVGIAFAHPYDATLFKLKWR